jgi:hypothetical protein
LSGATLVDGPFLLSGYPVFDPATEAPLGIVVTGIRLDEAFLDLSGTTRLHGAPPAATRQRVAVAMRAAVVARVCCSVRLRRRRG